MRIVDCGGCGNCIDFKCPAEAFIFPESNGKGYSSPVIDENLCVNCGLCLQEIECLCEAIKED
jgi:ferredoxin